MPTLLQLTPTRWVNLDRVTMIEYEHDHWHLTFADDGHWSTLDAEAGATLERYLLLHGRAIDPAVERTLARRIKAPTHG